MSTRSASSRAFEALGRLTWKLARRKAKDVVQEHRPGAPTRSTRLRPPAPRDDHRR